MAILHWLHHRPSVAGAGDDLRSPVNRTPALAHRRGNDDGPSRAAAPSFRTDGAGGGPNPGTITTS